MSDTITAAAIKFIRLRREKLAMLKRRNDTKCSECGDDYREGCFRSVRNDNGDLEDLPRDEWCQSCLDRQFLHELYHELTNKASGALRALEHAVNKEPE